MANLLLVVLSVACYVNCAPMTQSYAPRGPPVYGVSYPERLVPPYNHQSYPQYQEGYGHKESYPAAGSYQHQPACLQYYCYRFQMPNVTVTTTTTAAPAPAPAPPTTLLFQNQFQNQHQSHFQHPFKQPGSRMPGSSSGPQLFVNAEPRQAPAPAPGTCGTLFYLFCSAVSVSSGGSYQPIAACPSYLCSIPTTITAPTGCDPFNCQIVE